MKLHRNHVKIIAIIAACVVFTAVIIQWQTRGQTNKPDSRWYQPSQVAAGHILYKQNCVSCHGVAGVGKQNWRQRQADGSFPPPPLNGSAHTWHHSLDVLRRTIKHGNAQLGGKMPAFGDDLDDQDIDAIIAYLQSLWADQVYDVWAKENKISH